jgi:hypothetical protein
VQVDISVAQRTLALFPLRFISILLVIFGLTAVQALDEFIELNVAILEKQGIDATGRTTALKEYIEKLLDKYGLKREMRLLDPSERSKGCKLCVYYLRSVTWSLTQRSIVPISYKRHVGSNCMIRNFQVRQEETLNLTIAEAILATLASPPFFVSTSIFKDASTFEYISANLTLSNPIREIIKEAYWTFGEEAPVACLLSLGCGHPGVVVSPDYSDLASWNQFLTRLVMDSERKAQDIDGQMGHLGLYYRFCVPQGLEQNEMMSPTPEGIIEHTVVYLSGEPVSGKMVECICALKLRDGSASLEQLSQSHMHVLETTLTLTQHILVVARSLRRPCLL